MARVVLAGGGTAGHIQPMLATAEAIRRADPAAELACIGTERGLEVRLVPAAGLPLDLVPPVPMPRKPTVDLAKLPWRLADSVRRAARVLTDRRAEVVVGFGGYVAMPAYLAARAKGIPVVIHEQNAVPGLANKVATRFAARTLCAFPGTPLAGAEAIGMPMRRVISDLAGAGVDASARSAARARLGLAADLPVLLVSGGSQGARSINQATLAARDGLLAAGIQVVHVLGPKNVTDDLAVVTDPSTGAGYHPVGYVDDMATAYSAASLMVCRSGAGTVCEVGSIGLPAIFVPLPHGNGEQARNAEPLVAAGGGVLVADAELDGPRLLAEVTGIVGNPTRLDAMSGQAGRQLFAHDAADRLARIVLDLAAPPSEPASRATRPPATESPADDPGADHVA